MPDMLKAGALLLAVGLLAMPLMVSADADKQLQNVKGTVSYERGDGKRPLAHSATVVLADKDFAVTGDQSIGAVTLSDSSRVTMGFDTRVQIAYFNRLLGSAAKFVIYQGKTRFKIEHPNGKPANYTFQTPTAQIAVRGTEGDIGVDGRDLVVNVYGLSDANLPVVVSTEDGKSYTLHAGQQLVAKWLDDQIQTQVSALTEEAVAQFEEIGAPISDWAAAVANLPQSAVDAVTSELPFGSMLPGISLGRHPKAAPRPSPSPTPAPSPSP